jgi:hypothetical protein
LTVTLPLPFRASRSLGPGNPVLGEAGVTLDVVGLDFDDDIDAAWRRRIEDVARRLGWPDPRFHTFAVGVHHVLCFTAPTNQLQTAREANEWALCAAVFERDPCHWSALREALVTTDADLTSRTDADLTSRAGVGCPSLAAGLDEFEGVDEQSALDRFRRLARDEARALQPA